MKFRNGFVSNSSSSSFIVEFKKVPKTKKELQKILFGSRAEYHSPYCTDYYSTEEVAEIVWNDIKMNGPATEDKVKEAFKGYPEIPRYCTSLLELESPKVNDFKTGKKGKTGFDEYDWDAFEEAYEEYWKQFHVLINWKAVKEQRVFVFEYGDNDGALLSAMEHGDLFENAFNHLRISHH